MRPLSRDQLRSLDRRAGAEFGVPSLVLMENAGRGAADVLVALGIRGPVAVCCGKGNNGGDGLVLARHLALRGVRVGIHLFADPNELSADAAAQWQIVSALDLPRRVWDLGNIPAAELASEFARADWLVDGLYGTGLAGPVRPPLDAVINAMNAAPATIVALDIPSGLDADSGAPMGATIRARHTVTFAAPKLGFDNPDAGSFVGRVHVADIGFPASKSEESASERRGLSPS
jgi:NAD(P)H-hydrate epimerase